MTKPYSTLRSKMSPEARAKAEEQTQQLLREMPLQELRQARIIRKLQTWQGQYLASFGSDFKW